jgi:RNA polymerase sigma-70 factor (ECF subfamily)
MQTENCSATEFEKELYPHYNYFVRIASGLTRDHDDAKDLVQEAYIRAFRFFHTYEKGTNPKAWLYRILKNLYINYSIKKQKKPYSLSSFESPEAFSWYTTSMPEKQMSDEYVLAINSIKDEYRMVIILYHLEDYSIEDVAKFLDCPVGTVKSRLFRARKILRASLEKYRSKSLN